MSHFRNGFRWIVGVAQGFNFLCGIWIGLDGDDVKSFQCKSSSVRISVRTPFNHPREGDCPAKSDLTVRKGWGTMPPIVSCSGC